MQLNVFIMKITIKEINGGCIIILVGFAQELSVQIMRPGDILPQSLLPLHLGLLSIISYTCKFRRFPSFAR